MSKFSNAENTEELSAILKNAAKWSQWNIQQYHTYLSQILCADKVGDHIIKLEIPQQSMLELYSLLILEEK